MAQRNPDPTPDDDLDTDRYVPRTDLGRRLLALREQIVDSGTPLLDWDGLEREIAERRGGLALAEYEERTRS